MDVNSRHLVFGLGNPGPRYHRTRHNVGWRVVEALAARWRARETWAGPVYREWTAGRDGRDVHLVLPLTFMNVSGAALAAWMARHGDAREGLLAVSDDVYLPLGMLRFRPGGSSGGHRGLESLEAALAGDGWARLRLGVGAVEGAGALKEHVLETFGPDDADQVETMITRAADAVERWLDDGLAVAMNRYNRRATQETEEP
ncbi:MAG: aminoacyl-tRNA hydrolase [Candidatus Eisenbacteria bacterium]|uniref:Peptidyl-tRNA hydrolase n=1 Tax=Eiseniibacteriota bacterium TaxID=2212470 RepID=A0A9D6LAA1_UNCEI|nr:aminoacyl-tRNA hydrolase [Candidatus Eisenbacteria bacterium]MBI3538904.1 aminoacyl-tRNA hydrolase [Candidatus Eisenbacteria bacterium]